MKNSPLAARIAAGARVVALLLAVTLLAGCGGESQSETSQPSASSSGNSAKPHLDAGMEAWNAGNKQAAIAAFTEAVAVDPECKKAYLSRAMLYNERQEYKKAFNDFHKVIELDPNDRYAYDERAKIYRRYGKEAKAKADEKKADELGGKELDGYRERSKGAKQKR